MNSEQTGSSFSFSPCYWSSCRVKLGLCVAYSCACSQNTDQPQSVSFKGSNPNSYFLSRIWMTAWIKPTVLNNQPDEQCGPFKINVDPIQQQTKLDGGSGMFGLQKTIFFSRTGWCSSNFCCFSLKPTEIHDDQRRLLFWKNPFYRTTWSFSSAENFLHAVKWLYYVKFKSSIECRSLH